MNILPIQKKSLRKIISSIKHICFDLDGTIIDSKATIFKSTEAALKSLQINFSMDEDKFENMIGLHFLDIFKKFNVVVPDFEIFMNHYKQTYFEFIDESKVFSGVVEALNNLKSKNIKISLLTTKSQDQADKIIDHFKLRNYFDVVMGRQDGIAHKPSAEPLLLICKSLNVLPENSLIVGDTELDVECGKNAGAKTGAVTYGYRNREDLKALQPDLFIYNLSELNSYIPQKNNYSK